MQCAHIGSIIITSGIFQRKQTIHETVMDCMLYCIITLDNKHILLLNFKKKTFFYKDFFSFSTTSNLFCINKIFKDESVACLVYFYLIIKLKASWFKLYFNFIITYWQSYFQNSSFYMNSTLKFVTVKSEFNFDWESYFQIVVKIIISSGKITEFFLSIIYSFSLW